MCAATVSARRPGCSMPASAVSTSGGTFLLSFTYCSNCEITERASTSISRSSYCLDVRQRRRRRPRSSSPACELRRCVARSTPSTSTLTVPSGSFSSCRIVATVPMRYRSSRFGIVDVGLLLGDQQDALVGAHGRVERLDRLLAPDEQRNHHVRIDDDVAQRQHRHVCGTGRQFGVSVLMRGPLDSCRRGTLLRTCHDRNVTERARRAASKA